MIISSYFGKPNQLNDEKRKCKNGSNMKCLFATLGRSRTISMEKSVRFHFGEIQGAKTNSGSALKILYSLLEI